MDLTLVDRGGRELDMGTGFDAMTSLSHHFNPGVSARPPRGRGTWGGGREGKNPPKGPGVAPRLSGTGGGSGVGRAERAGHRAP